jgi:hypothetical protein
MAKECFCGCGRSVPFGRKRITNMLGRQLSDDVALFQGAVERTPDPEHDADLRRLITAGIPLRDKLAAVIHGTLDRDDYPRDEGKRWLEEAGEHRKRLAMQVVDADFAGWDAHEQSLLLRAGVAAPATIVHIADTGTTINEAPRVELTVRVEPPDGGEPFELKRKLVVSRVHIPRVGERLTVFYDRGDPSKFTFKNSDVADDPIGAATPAEPDPVEQIAKLAELHAAGSLTDTEFAEAKQRLLGDL